MLIFYINDRNHFCRAPLFQQWFFSSGPSPSVARTIIRASNQTREQANQWWEISLDRFRMASVDCKHRRERKHAHTYTANSLSCSGFRFGPQAFPDLVLKNNQRNSTRKSHGARYNHNSSRSRLWLQPSFTSCHVFIPSGLLCGLILARIWIQTQLESQILKNLINRIGSAKWVVCAGTSKFQ